MSPRIALLAVMLTTAACAPQFHPLVPNPTIIKNYDLGRTRSATVGDPIFRVQRAAEIPTFVTRYEYKIPGIRNSIPAGTRFVAVGINKNGNLQLRSPTLPLPGFLVTTQNGSRVWAQGETSRSANELKTKEPLFSQVTEIGDQPGAFTAELIYSGLAGSVVRAVYREYVGNLARPAFSQELQYDLSKEDVIAFRSIRAKITKATNTEIQYVVSDDGGLPWLPWSVR